MFFYKKIYNLIIIFTLIILTCLNNKCLLFFSNFNTDILIEKRLLGIYDSLHKLYKNAFNEYEVVKNSMNYIINEKANVDLTIKTFIEDMINLSLQDGYISNTFFQVERLKAKLATYSKRIFYNFKKKKLEHFTYRNYFGFNRYTNTHEENLVQDTRVFIDICSLAHTIFNFISKDKYDKSKIDEHPLFSYHQNNIKSKDFSSWFYRKLKDKYEETLPVYSSQYSFNRDYFNWFMKNNKHMYLNIIKYELLHQKFYTSSNNSIRNLYNMTIDIKRKYGEEKFNKHSENLPLLKCKNDDKAQIYVNCVKEFLNDDKSFFDTKVYKFFKDKTIFVK